jgi:hypothetical protein
VKRYARRHLSDSAVLHQTDTRFTLDASHTADLELLVAATHKTKLEIQHLLAARYPQPDVPSRIEALVSTEPILQQAPGPVDGTQLVVRQDPEPVEQAPGPVDLALRQVLTSSPVPLPGNTCSKVKPLSPQRYEVGFTMGQSAHDKLRHAQELLGRQVAPGDVAAVFERALVREIGRDGDASDGIRLRCPAHNQYTAELTFGPEFMRHKRIAAAEKRAAEKARRRPGSTAAACLPAP